MAASAGAIRAGRAFIELFTDDRKMIRGLRRASARLKAFGAGVQGIGLKMMGAGAAIVAPLLGATKLFASMGDQVNKMAARTGMSTEALSELGFAAEQSGTDLATLEKGIAGMQRNILSAERGLSTAVDTFEDLGLSVKDLQGLSPEQQFELLADRISQVEDPSRRAALAMQIFGKSGQKLLPMMADGAAGIAMLRKEAQQLGLSIGAEDAQAAAELTDAWNRVKRSLKGAAFAIGAALAPMLTETLDKVKQYVVGIGNWIKEHKQAVVAAFKFGVALLAAGAAVTAIGTAIVGAGVVLGSLATIASAVGTAFSVIGTVLAAVLSPIGLLVAAVVGLGAYLVHASGAGGKALEWLGDTFGNLLAIGKDTVKGISDALVAGDVGLAAKVLWAGLQVAWQEGTAALTRKWTEWKFATARIFQETWDGLRVIFAESIAQLESIWVSFTAGFRKHWKGAQNEIGKGLAYLIMKAQGLDDDIIEKTLKVEDKRTKTDTSNIEAEKQRRLDEIRTTKDAKVEAIGAEHDSAMRQLDKMEGAATSAAERRLADARKEFEETLAKAKQAGDVARAKQADEKSESDKTPDFGEMAAATSSARGTFSAAFAGRLGSSAGGPAERTAKAAETTNKKLDDLIQIDARLEKAFQAGVAFA